MTYKLIIFDFDGTLADTLPYVMGVMDKIAHKFNFPPLTPEELDLVRGSGAGKVFKSRKIPAWKLLRIARYVQKLMAQEIDQIRLFDGAEALLHQLARAGMPMALVSSNALQNVQRALGPENSSLFQAYECGASILGKQNRFRKILRNFGVNPTEALAIGDEMRDLEAAGKAGIPFGAVAWGYTRLEALLLHHPAEVFYQITDISRLLLDPA